MLLAISLTTFAFIMFVVAAVATLSLFSVFVINRWISKIEVVRPEYKIELGDYVIHKSLGVVANDNMLQDFEDAIGMISHATNKIDFDNAGFAMDRFHLLYGYNEMHSVLYNEYMARLCTVNGI